MTFGLIGLVAGFFGGLVGLGGGVLMVPLLTGWGRLSQHEAHGTSLAGVVFTGIAGAATYATGGAVAVGAALWVALASVVATYAAARHSRNVSALSLRRILGGFLLVTALILPFEETLLALPHPAGAGAVLILVGTGLLVGTLSGLLGIGGGALLVPLLVLAAGLPQHVAQGTSLAAMVPAGLAGTWVHARIGHVRRPALWTLLPGIVAGSWIGGRAALAIPEPPLRVVFAIVLVGLGAYYLRGARRRPAEAAAAE